MTSDRLRWVGLSPSDLRAPLVGRGHELRVLEDALARVRESRQTEIVTVLGPSGIGKSRLVYEFFARIDTPDEGEGLRVYRGSARGSAAAYAVFEKILRSRFGLVDGMDADASKALVRAQVASLLEDRKVGDVLFFLGQLLGIPFPDSPLTKAVGEDAVEARLVRRTVLRALIEADAAASPLAFFFDDLDAAHEDSLELLSFLLANLTGPILIVCAARNDLLSRRERFSALGARHKTIELGTLTDAEAATVMEALLSPCGETPQPLVEAACGVAGGNPMLLERMVRVFLDNGVLEVVPSAAFEQTWSVHVDRLDAAHLPLTVEDAVEARIAALSTQERKLLERAAAMGSVFWLGGLRALERTDETPPDLWVPVAGDGTQSTSHTLAELIARDYILHLPDSTFSGEQEYVFKHNKERERIAQYTSGTDLRGYHQVIADWLEHKTGVRSHEEHMGMLARHRELAGAKTRAAFSYLEAGSIARSRYAHQKAAEYYQKGLELLVDRDAGRRIDALHDYGDVLLAVGRADLALLQFKEMKALAWRLEMMGKGGAAHNRIGRLFRETGKLDEAAKHLSTGLALFEKAGDERGIASSLDDIGKLKWVKGDYPRALEEMRRALAMRRSLGDRRGIALSLNNIGAVLQDSGEYKQALEAFEQSIVIRREIGDLLGVAGSLNNLGTVAQDLHDHQQALSLFEEAHAIAREVGDKNRIALILTNVGETHYRLGNHDEAVRILTQVEELCEELGDKLGLAEAVRGLGKAYLLRGDLAKARQHIARAVDLFTAVRSKSHLGIALRTLGEVTAAGGWGADHTQKARDYFLRAITIFEEIGNELDLARACRAYAEFLRSGSAATKDEALVKEAEQVEQRAEEIFGRLSRSLPAADSWSRTPRAPVVGPR